jgi:hypothetical protein
LTLIEIESIIKFFGSRGEEIMKIIDVMWFCGSSNVGIVRVEDEYDGIRYFIGSPPMAESSANTEEQDMKWIADWGSTFPKAAGDALFGN